MRHLAIVVAALALASAGTFAANDRVAGVVLKISAQENFITVETAPHESRTLSLTDTTVFKRGSKTVQLEDVSVGDHVVVEVLPKTARAIVVQVVDAPPATRK